MRRSQTSHTNRRPKKTPVVYWIIPSLIACSCIVYVALMVYVSMSHRTAPIKFKDQHHRVESAISWDDTLKSIEMRDLSNFDRIVVFGDLHGDYNQALNALKLGNIINANNDWIATKTILIQTGDIVDRGSESIKIYKLFIKLRQQALNYGSMCLNTIGNHEHLNFINDFTYVNAQEMQFYGGYAKWQQLMSIRSDIGRFLHNLPIARIIGNNLFVHAGILPIIATHFKKNLTFLNEAFHSHIMKTSEQIVEPVQFYQSLTESEQMLTGLQSPIWTRYYEPNYYDMAMTSNAYKYYQANKDKTAKNMTTTRTQIITLFMCNLLNDLFEIYHIKRMFIGHNLQMSGQIGTYCNDKLYLIDVGMSSFYGGNLAAIEIDARTEQVKILKDVNKQNQPIAFI